MAKKTDVLLDLLPDVEIAHESAPPDEKEEKEEIEQETKVKRSKRTSESDNEDDELMKWLKYAAIGGIGIIAFGLLMKRYRKRYKEPDMHDLMMLMIYQTMLQNMQRQNQQQTTLPPQIVTDDNTKFSTDWSKWYDENQGKEFTKFGTNKSKTLNQMHIAENWKVRRNLNGEIFSVAKTNEYIR